MTQAEIIPTFALLLFAGSETTSTLLAAATYYLSIHQDIMTKLTAEIRAAFKAEDEINIVAVNKLNYLLAVLDETLRIHPPVARGTTRLTPPEGAWIDGIRVSLIFQGAKRHIGRCLSNCMPICGFQNSIAMKLLIGQLNVSSLSE